METRDKHRNKSLSKSDSCTTLFKFKFRKHIQIDINDQQ